MVIIIIMIIQICKNNGVEIEAHLLIVKMIMFVGIVLCLLLHISFDKGMKLTTKFCIVAPHLTFFFFKIVAFKSNDEALFVQMAQGSDDSIVSVCVCVCMWI